MKLRLFYIFSYLKRPRWDTGLTPPELTAQVAALPPGRFLDIGCGTGTNVLSLARHGWQATGFDFAPQAIWQARRKARTANLSAELLVADATDPRLLPDRQFDLILDMGCLHSFDAPRQQAYRLNLQRWLAPGGYFLLYGFTKPQDAPADQRGLRPSDLAALQALFPLQRRQDGDDHQRPSAWFWFQRPL